MKIDNIKTLESKGRLIWLEYSLVGCSALLLMIWNLRDTIALRNILIYGGLALSLFYIYRCIQLGELSRRIIPWRNWLPFLSIPCVFILVLFYYLVNPEEPALQLQELTSVWARAAAGSILAFGVGLVIRKHPSWIQILGLGLGSVFILLIVESLPGVVATGNPFNATQDVLSNLVRGKVYGVLVGTIYVAGLLGLIIDSLKNKSLLSRLSLTLALVIAITIFCSYVFILDTRNGLGIGLLLICTWFFVHFIQNLRLKNSQDKSAQITKLILAGIIIFGMLGWLAVKQFQHNSQWPNFIEDVKFSAQIDRHNTWRHTSPIEPYPTTPDGHVVAPSTYERVAWFVAASSLISNHPFGSGVLYQSFGRELKKVDPGSSVTTSHSAWLDYALSLGYVGLLFIWWPLILAWIFSWVWPSSLSSVVRWTVAGLFSIYGLGELFNESAVEFLFFLLTFLPTLMLQVPISTLKDNQVLSKSKPL